MRVQWPLFFVNTDHYLRLVKNVHIVHSHVVVVVIVVVVLGLCNSDPKTVYQNTLIFKTSKSSGFLLDKKLGDYELIF